MTPMSLYLRRSLLTIRGFEVQPKASILTLAIHGWLDNCYSFKPLSQHLGACHLLAVDLPGHGESDQLPAGQAYDFHQYLVWLHEIQLAAEAPKIRLIGHSMGAAIASLYAGVFPEKVESLALIDGLGPLSIAENDGPQRMRTHIESWINRKQERNSLFPSFEDAVNARQKASSLSRQSAEILAERGTMSHGDSVIWRHDPRMKLPSRYQFSQTQVLSYLAKITCPTLLVQGTRSMLPQHGLVEERMQAIGQFERIVIEGGHHLHMDAAEETGKAIYDFFARTKIS